MPKLGSHRSQKNDENGRLYFGDKDADFLKKSSRTAVEEHHNSPIIFLEIDWIGSQKNFYGEMTMKKFVNPRGIHIRGIYKLSQSSITENNGLANKYMKLTVSLYDEQLKELDIKPKRGDYFAVGSRMYQIYDHTINDVGPGNLMMNREKIRTDYFAFEEDDETIDKNIWLDTLDNGLENNNGLSTS